jgi:hypothetical protein
LIATGDGRVDPENNDTLQVLLDRGSPFGHRQHRGTVNMPDRIEMVRTSFGADLIVVDGNPLKNL